MKGEEIICARCGTKCVPVGNGQGKTKYCIECKVELFLEYPRNAKRGRSRLKMVKGGDQE